MQSDNAPNLTAEVSNEFMKASQVTKVTSTAGHLRTQGLVERQNRTLLTLLRVFCSRRMRDWALRYMSRKSEFLSSSVVCFQCKIVSNRNLVKECNVYQLFYCVFQSSSVTQIHEFQSLSN